MKDGSVDFTNAWLPLRNKPLLVAYPLMRLFDPVG
jgi:hypothetical protein